MSHYSQAAAALYSPGFTDHPSALKLRAALAEWDALRSARRRCRYATRPDARALRRASAAALMTAAVCLALAAGVALCCY